MLTPVMFQLSCMSLQHCQALMCPHGQGQGAKHMKILSTQILLCYSVPDLLRQRGVDWPTAAADLSWVPVLAVGSNAGPAQLARKFPAGAPACAVLAACVAAVTCMTLLQMPSSQLQQPVPSFCQHDSSHRAHAPSSALHFWVSHCSTCPYSSGCEMCTLPR